MVRFTRSLLALPAAVVLLAACGSSSGSGTTPPASAGANATVDAYASSLGNILVDGHGNTLYLFQKDTSATSSACTGDCAANWPPLVSPSSSPDAGTGVDGNKLGTLTRPDGSQQVVYFGHPLYTFTGDHASGETNGEGKDAFGGHWYVVGTDGKEIVKSSGY